LADAGVTIHWVAPGAIDDDLLEALFDLHERRRMIAGTTSTFDRTREPLLRALNRCASEGRGPAAVVAERSGEPVGLLYGFVWDGVFAFYQSGWDPKWSAFSLGALLIDQGIRLAGPAGIHTWDFLRGAQPYKYRFGAVDRVDETWLVPTGVWGRVLDARFRLKARMISGVGG
jgi:CelD/BcsL family acetyltransferase involved in cellulose biosynthesis